MTRTRNHFVVAAGLAAALALAPASAFAYVGPGAGLSLLGALWGLVVAIGLALAFVVAWPLRRMLRSRRGPARPEPTPGRHDARTADGAAAAASVPSRRA